MEQNNNKKKGNLSQMTTNKLDLQLPIQSPSCEFESRSWQGVLDTFM
jgi:hypothetical protein